jgi:hypothetical protein
MEIIMVKFSKIIYEPMDKRGLGTTGQRAVMTTVMKTKPHNLHTLS